MALVKLRNDWFGPDKHLYRKDDGGTEIPDRFLGKLPSNAKVISGRPAAAEQPEDSLRNHDGDRANGDAFADASEEADKQRMANAARIREKLAKEKAGK